MESNDRAPRGVAPEAGDLAREAPAAIQFLLVAAIRDLEFRLETGMPAPGGAAGRLPAIRAHLRNHEIAAPLSFLGLQASGSGDLPTAEMVDACRTIRDWAAARGAHGLMHEFAQLMARLAPDDLTTVLEAARIARDTGDHTKAEIRFRHVIRQARRSNAWDKYTKAFIGLALLYHTAGNHAEARVLLERARRAAYRHRLRSDAGAVHHEFIAFAGEAGQVGDMYAHASAALRYYGPGHPRLKELTHDLGRFWIDIGEYSRALPVLEAVLPFFENDVDERTRCRANVGWAAAGAGDLRKFAAYKCATIHAIHRGARPQIAAEAFLHLAYALELLGRLDAAQEMAEDARQYSAAARAVYIQAKADGLLERLRQPSEPRQHVSRPVIETPQTARRGQQLAQALASAASHCTCSSR